MRDQNSASSRLSFVSGAQETVTGVEMRTLDSTTSGSCSRQTPKTTTSIVSTHRA